MSLSESGPDRTAFAPLLHDTKPHRAKLFAAAGLLYVFIIAAGLTSELFLRGPLLGADPAATAANLAVSGHLLAASVLADAAMVAADVAIAVVLFLILAPAGPALAAAATVFRLIQAAVIAANLLTLLPALLGADPGAAHQALIHHAYGYDLGLIFFGINSLLVGLLLMRHVAFPVWLGALMMAAGAVYLAGSTLRIVAPEAYALFQPAYGIAVLAEAAFAIALLLRSLRPLRQTS